MVETLDFGECGLKTVPLGFVLGAPGGDGNRIFESGIVRPEGEFLERGTASEKL